jgi:acetylornithine deacetylase/succinyl-diaminopimelate desuccinylase-like protein
MIQRVERTNLDLMKKDGIRGTVVMSRISSTSASLNAVPSECEAYLDRRMAPGETEEGIRGEMDNIVKGKDAHWEIGTLQRKSWTGMDITYEPFHLPWKIEMNHPLTKACIASYRECKGAEPEYDFWDFSTNGVTPVSMGIPTIGFGPGEYKLAHMRDENCAVDKIVDACSFYSTLLSKI